MASSVIGIDFGSSGIKLAEVRTSNGIPTVINQAFMPFESETVINGEPQEERVETIATELKAFLAAHKFVSKEAFMGYNSTKDIYVNRALTNWHAPKDFKTAIGFDIIADKSLLLGAPEGVLIDAVIFGETADMSDRRKLDVLLCGVSPRLANTQVAIVQKAGLHVVGADLSALAALRAVALTERSEDSLDVLIDIGKDVLTVLIHENGKPYSITLQSDAAGSTASKAISEEILDDHQERIDRSKTTHSRNFRVKRGVENYCFTINAAIRNALQSYLQSRSSPATIASISLIGGGSLLLGLREAIQQELDVQVGPAALDPSIGGSPLQFFEGPILASDYTVSIGLAMGAKA